MPFPLRLAGLLAPIDLCAVGQGQLQVAYGGSGRGDGGGFVPAEIVRSGLQISDGIIDLTDGGGDARVVGALVLSDAHGRDGTEECAEDDIAKGFHEPEHTVEFAAGQRL